LGNTGMSSICGDSIVGRIIGPVFVFNWSRLWGTVYVRALMDVKLEFHQNCLCREASRPNDQRQLRRVSPGKQRDRGSVDVQTKVTKTYIYIYIYYSPIKATQVGI
jgi:hypothetical protein